MTSSDEFEDFLRQLGEDMKAAALDAHVGWARSNAVLDSMRTSVLSPDDPDFLTPEELAALQAAPSLALEAALAMDHWSARADNSVARAFLRSELLYGAIATREHSPYVTRLPRADGSPIGIEGSDRLWGLTAMVEARCEQEGLSFRTSMVIPTPHMEVSGEHDRTGMVRYEDLVQMYETGADDERIAEVLSTCGFDGRKALFVLRDGIAPPLAEGML